MGRWMGSLLGALVLLSLWTGCAESKCSFTSTLKEDHPQRAAQNEAMKKLNALDPTMRNRKFTAPQDGYQYTVQLCPDDSASEDYAAVVQEKPNDPNFKKIVGGRYNESDVHVGETGTMMLVYTKGDNYSGACQKGERHSLVTLFCDHGRADFFLDMLSESAGTGEDFCFYSFNLMVPPGKSPELDSLLNCTPGNEGDRAGARGQQSPQSSSTTAPNPDAARHGLGAGAIILIVICVPLLSFFIIGSIYKRFVVGAQGWEQVPFIDTFRRCGSLQKDGLRSAFGRSPRTGNVYDQYTAVSTDEERQPLERSGNTNDDHLLPM